MQHILGLVRRCVEDYNMIEAGETVAVGVSGGKDSLLTLTALARLRAFYPKPFRVEAITLETGMPGMDFSPVADYCAALDVPYTRISLPVVKNTCPMDGHSRRQEVKELLAELEQRYPDLKKKLFGAVQRYPLYGWDLETMEK